MSIEQRLARLRDRRVGSDRSGRVPLDQQIQILRKRLEQESYEQRQGGRPYTRYTLGAMAEVDADYTRISVESAGRVGNQLATRLPREGIAVEFRLQGSVPLNVHIRGVSDVDLLVIGTRSLYYSPHGAGAIRGEYAPNPSAPLSLLSSIRSTSEGALKDAYPAADVDIKPPKAIKISGGSLARPVDVVPAVWNDTYEYQRTRLEVERGVCIYHKTEHRAIENLPFLHIARVSARDDQTLGGLRKAIRLCKNVKADAEEDGRTIGLCSYDIAGLLYHADPAALRAGVVRELAVLAEVQRHLDWCYQNPRESQALVTPDGSRKILDTKDRVDGLLTLSVQVDELAKQVAREHSLELRLVEQIGLYDARRVLEGAVLA